jgi:hypothetical protein
MDVKNKCLLTKWLDKLFTGDWVWQSLLHNKHLSQKLLSSFTTKPADSHFWRGIMTVKGDFMQFESLCVENGELVRFWEDR